MTTLALLFVGAVLLLNGLAVLERLDGRSAAAMNLFGGALLLAAGLYEALPARDLSVASNVDTIIKASGALVFAFTYLYVGINGYTGDQGDGLGWFCGWAAALSAVLAAANFGRLDDPREGVLWLLWVVLFASFFVLLALKREDYRTLVGWITLIESVITASVPGILMMFNDWNRIPVSVVIAAGAVTVLCFLVIGLAAGSRRSTARIDVGLGFQSDQ